MIITQKREIIAIAKVRYKKNNIKIYNYSKNVTKEFARSHVNVMLLANLI